MPGISDNLIAAHHRTQLSGFDEVGNVHSHDEPTESSVAFTKSSLFEPHFQHHDALHQSLPVFKAL